MGVGSRWGTRMKVGLELWWGEGCCQKLYVWMLQLLCHRFHSASHASNSECYHDKEGVASTHLRGSSLKYAAETGISLWFSEVLPCAHIDFRGFDLSPLPSDWPTFTALCASCGSSRRSIGRQEYISLGTRVHLPTCGSHWMRRGQTLGGQNQKGIYPCFLGSFPSIPLIVSKPLLRLKWKLRIHPTIICPHLTSSPVYRAISQPTRRGGSWPCSGSGKNILASLSSIMTLEMRNITRIRTDRYSDHMLPFCLLVM